MSAAALLPASTRTALRRKPAAILFDWGHTLVNFPGILSDRAGHMACFARALDAAAAEASEWIRAVERERLAGAYERAAVRMVEASERTLREHRFEDRLAAAFAEAAPRETVPESLIAALAQRLATEIAAGATPIEHAAETLGALSATSRIGVVSNYPSTRAVIESLHRLGLAGHVHGVVVSEAVGWLKPDRRMFEAAFARFAVAPADVLFVGNDLVTDMRGARSAGCMTAWYAPHAAAADATADVDLHLPGLAALCAVLGGGC
jgi:putative hydrolase of the HAD superfamily